MIHLDFDGFTDGNLKLGDPGENQNVMVVYMAARNYHWGLAMSGRSIRNRSTAKRLDSSNVSGMSPHLLISGTITDLQDLQVHFTSDSFAQGEQQEKAGMDYNYGVRLANRISTSRT